MMISDRVHDRELLDYLERLEAVEFQRDVWRIVRSGRDPLRGASAHGRWGAAGEFEVIYTACNQDGALAEIGYRLSLEPIWPSRIEHDIHSVNVSLANVLDLSDFGHLSELGVNEDTYENHDYNLTQAISSAARFLGFQAIIVPNARYRGNNVVVFPDAPDVLENVSLVHREAVDWSSWRAANRTRPSRRK